MEIVLWAYQIVPGNDEMLLFSQTEHGCREAALEQRAELKRQDPDANGDLNAMAVYRFVFRPMSTMELVAVLNEDKTLLESCVVDRRLVGLVAETKPVA